MNRLTAPAAVGLALCTVSLCAESATDDRRAVQAAYSASNAAAGRRDVAGTLAHFTPDAVTVDTKGHATRMAQERQTVTGLFAAAQSVTARTTLETFTLDRPGQATATVHEHILVTLTDPKTHQPLQLTVDDTARDLWVKTGGGWRQKHSQDLTYSSTLNGQPPPTP